MPPKATVTGGLRPPKSQTGSVPDYAFDYSLDAGVHAGAYIASCARSPLQLHPQGVVSPLVVHSVPQICCQSPGHIHFHYIHTDTDDPLGRMHQTRSHALTLRTAGTGWAETVFMCTVSAQPVEHVRAHISPPRKEFNSRQTGTFKVGHLPNERADDHGPVQTKTATNQRKLSVTIKSIRCVRARIRMFLAGAVLRV